MAYHRELTIEIRDEHGDSMGDNLFARLATANALEWVTCCSCYLSYAQQQGDRDNPGN